MDGDIVTMNVNLHNKFDAKINEVKYDHLQNILLSYLLLLKISIAGQSRTPRSISHKLHEYLCKCYHFREETPYFQDQASII
jgi:hypothetical protein